MFMRSFIMNWKTIFAAGLLLVPVHISGVLAGFEPTPFQPEINQLGAVANILSSADFRVANTMSVPPDPCVPPEPCKGLDGAVNRLEAIDNQIGSADNMVQSMINEVMGFEPMPFHDLIAPLEVVRDAAEGIVIKIDEFPVDSAAPEFLEALGQVSGSALLLIGTVDDGIVQLLGEPMACEDYGNESDCSDAGCYWDFIGECLPLVD
jgi:hypothetical protein